MSNYIILLPPSEGKNKDGESDESSFSFQKLNLSRELILNKLLETISKEPESKLEKLFDVKGINLIQTLEINSNIRKSKTLKAIERYSGVMFKAINYENMSINQKQNFDNSVLFIDGLFGLLKPLDLIPNYKLKINSKLQDIDVTKFWKSELETYLDNLFKNKLIIDILPQAHRNVIADKFKEKLIEISFYEIKNGKLKNVGHASKKLKGEIINYIVKKEKITLEDLYNFTHSEGYSFSRIHSSTNSIIYLKNQ